MYFSGSQSLQIIPYSSLLDHMRRLRIYELLKIMKCYTTIAASIWSYKEKGGTNMKWSFC